MRARSTIDKVFAKESGGAAQAADPQKPALREEDRASRNLASRHCSPKSNTGRYPPRASCAIRSSRASGRIYKRSATGGTDSPREIGDRVLSKPIGPGD